MEEGVSNSLPSLGRNAKPMGVWQTVSVCGIAIGNCFYFTSSLVSQNRNLSKCYRLTY